MQMNGINLEQLKTIASLIELSPEERKHQIEKASRDARELKEMLEPAEYLASLHSILPGERDARIMAFGKILES